MNHSTRKLCINFFCLLIFTFIICSCESDSNKETESQADLDEEDSISQVENDTLSFSETIRDMDAIREEYEKTLRARQIGLLDSTSIRYNCAEERKGTITYFKTGEDLRLIEKNYSEYSHTEGVDQYYISNEKPYFIFYDSANWHFDFDTEQDGDYTENIHEERYYILGDTLTTCLYKEYETRSSSDNNPDQIENEVVKCPPLQNLLDKYKTLLSHQNGTTDIGCL